MLKAVAVFKACWTSGESSGGSLLGIVTMESSVKIDRAICANLRYAGLGKVRILLGR